MKCPSYEATRTSIMEKNCAAESRELYLKASPVKEPLPIKPQSPPAGVTTVLFSLNNNTRAVHDKENSASREHDRPLDEVLEDSGYLSLQNSQNEDHHGDEDHILENPAAPFSPEKTNKSPSKRQTKYCLVPKAAASTPIDCQRRKIPTCLLSSTPKDNYREPKLPILNFQHVVCEKLAKSYQKNKRYDWSIPSQVAEDHLLDRVIGGQMGLEYVDVFSSLLSRNMRSILVKILALLCDLDLIRCKMVSKTWRSIICEDAVAQSRCQKAKQGVKPWSSSAQSCSNLTRDVAVSRLVLSSMQELASANKRTAASQKSKAPTSQSTRFNEYVKAAQNLKQHESLRSCGRCGSPSTYSAEAKRATCTRHSCQFDFCTQCQQVFHGSSPCREVQSRSLVSSRSNQILPGSARSKRNVRRL